MRGRKISLVFGVNDFLIGGMQRQFIEQLRFLDRDRFDVSLITLFEFPDQPDLYDELPLHLAVYRMHFKNVRDVKQWRELYRLLKHLKPDVVISSLFFSNTVFRLLKPFIGYHSIACEHNTYTEKTFLQRLTDKLLANISYRIIAVSNTVADFTAHQEGISKDKFVIIPNGIDVQAWQQEFERLPSKEIIRKELIFPSDSIVILNVARLMPQKNHELLLKGFAQFHRGNPKSMLAVVGDGPLRKELESLTQKLNIEDSVIFFGMRRDVNRFYKGSDIFALTSDREGFALVCIEAMTAGLPVISTVTAGPDEYIANGVNGFLIHDATATGVADGIREVVKGDSGKLRKGALETAERYNIVSSVKLYEQLFDDTIRH